MKIKHVWHENDGFRKTTILNEAIKHATNDYLIFTDGDYIPHNDFFESQLIKVKKGKFLSGGNCKLPMNISKIIEQKDIDQQTCFDINWLKPKGTIPNKVIRNYPPRLTGVNFWMLNSGKCIV